MRRLTTLVAATLAATLIWGACDEGTDPVGPREVPDQPSPAEHSPTSSISDAANGGNEHFYWLPPMVSNPSPTGTFDGSRSPHLMICELDGADCAVPQPTDFPIVFTLTGGPSGETITVSGDKYQANWHTDEVPLDPNEFYRVEVTVGVQSLGHADIDPVSNGKGLKNVDTEEYIGLVNGRTLPIKFRIEDGAVDEEGPVTSTVAGAPNPAPVGVDVDLTASVDDALTGNSDIASAEYNIDAGPLVAMSAQDGTFDSPTEVVAATIPGFGSPGDYTVCVRGTDAAGNTGAEVCTTVTVEGFAWAQVSTGANHACAVSTDGTPYCWGFGNTGQLGHGTTASKDVPTLVSGGLSIASIDAAGDGRTCAITTSGQTYCWGENFSGELGIGSTGPNELTPALVAGGHTFQEVHNSGSYTCARDLGGAAYCWGNNSFGWVGDGTFTSRVVPTAVVGGLTFQSLSIGAGSCGLTTGGAGYCWGGTGRSQLGNGGTAGSFNTPQPIAGGHTFDELEIWGDSGCGLEPGGDVYCWGTNWTGALAVAPIDVAGSAGEPTPLLAGVPTNFVALAAGGFFNCGLDGSGAAYCWGQNKSGTLGVDPATTTEDCREFTPTITSTCSSVPVPVSGGHSFVQIDAGTNNVCGLTTDGEIWCWGRADIGALGDGSGFASPFSFTPVQVVDPI